MVQTYIGAPIVRKEDVRFLTGKAQFVDDVKLPHMLHAAILRSLHPHARILTIDATAALQIAGVVAVFTFQDIAETVEPRPIPMRRGSYSGLERFLQYALARDKVRYVGEPGRRLLKECPAAFEFCDLYPVLDYGYYGKQRE